MSEKKQANVGDLVDFLVSVRNAIDDFVNKVGTEALAPEASQEKATERAVVPKFTAEDYNRLGWTSFQTKKGQTWERIDIKTEYVDKTLEAIKKDLIECCWHPEATIQVPMLAYDYGYWIFKDAMYRRPMPKP